MLSGETFRVRMGFERGSFSYKEADSQFCPCDVRSARQHRMMGWHTFSIEDYATGFRVAYILYASLSELCVILMGTV